ncbi:MAG: DNA recombination protein RmuC [Bacteroidales bacterium]|nr:DNA recombination protein RmuC [Bacteroidales bacterium]
MGRQMVQVIIIVVAAAVAGLLAWLLTRLALRARYDRELTAARAALETEKALRAREADIAAERLEDARKDYERSLAELKESQAQALEATKKELSLASEKALREREENLKKTAGEMMTNITGGLNQRIATMTEAFEAQKKQHTEESAALKTKVDEAVKNFAEQSRSLGDTAEHLASALRGDNKMQGNWGEQKLNNIFVQEGLVEGRDYHREVYLRDEGGEILRNEDSGRKMRPDYVLHFPDNTDILIDAKMNLDAFVDWYNADNEADRTEFAKRNLAAVRAQVASLAGKRYSEYVQDGHKTLNYVIMYVANYGALALARTLEPNIVNDAFRQNVLITTEETIMPFLRVLHTAWVNVDQIRNQEKIVKAASQMVERVQDYFAAHTEVGKRLHDAMEAHEKGTRKLQEGGQSIIHAAHEVERLSGIKPNPRKASLPEVEE